MSSFGDEWIWGICLTVAIHLLKGSLYFPCPFFPLGFPSLTIGFPEENPNNLTYILLFFSFVLMKSCTDVPSYTYALPEYLSHCFIKNGIILYTLIFKLLFSLNNTV